MARIGYLGPPGTFSHEALLADLRDEAEGDELVAFPSIYETVMAVQAGEVDAALVPIENSLGGAITVTLDTLVLEAPGVRMVGEVVLSIGQCLIVSGSVALEEIDLVLSHPQASVQCAGFLRRVLPRAEVRMAASTAEAVRQVAEHGGSWAALGSRTAAERYGCRILAADVEDMPGNQTRFVWLAGGEPGPPLRRSAPLNGTEGKTAIVFWGPGTDSAGWLVGCLREFADRRVNLTRIESRPRRQGLGQYMFFVDLEGLVGEARVDAALEALAEQVEELRVLGSFS